ncbi:MAG: sulfur carrier protein ThiS [Salinisphaeraceae bacterium]|nr:sulfur carrier protein ThiS [Salinisphaeraceae bacterium]
MQLIINGESQQFDSPLTIAALLSHLDMTKRRVAVELNGEIIPRSQHEHHQLSDGDKLEIVHAIGGGQHQS